MAIITKTEVENYLLTTIDPSFDIQFELWVLAVQEYINTLTNRLLIGDTGETTRIYDGNNTPIIFIDDVREISEVTSGDTVLSTDSYTPAPYNEGYYNRLYRTGGIWSASRRGSISVTGKFGMYAPDSVPRDLQLACIILVAGIIQASSNENKEIASETIGRYSVSYKTDRQRIDYLNAMNIIKSYRRISI